jgi:hypothetical protein
MWLRKGEEEKKCFCFLFFLVSTQYKKTIKLSVCENFNSWYFHQKEWTYWGYEENEMK